MSRRRVPLQFDVVVDVDAWRDEYGYDAADDAVVDTVRADVLALVRHGFAHVPDVVDVRERAATLDVVDDVVDDRCSCGHPECGAC